jgi:flagellar biosynthesis repressor protein FlbT
MSSSLQISLRPGERIYINGAVIRVDRKVTLEFLNDVTFLLENHIIFAEDTTTPLRQLYFVVQTMLIDPASHDSTKLMFEESMALLVASFKNPEILGGLATVYDLVGKNKLFEALKMIRAMFPIEEAVLAKEPAPRLSTILREFETQPYK